MQIKIQKIREDVTRIFRDKGFSEEDTYLLVDYLLWAEMSGNATQGLLKMVGTEPIQDIIFKHDILVERDTKVSQLLNAGAHPAIVVSQKATSIVIEKAKSSGIGIVGIHNTFSSNGSQAFYAERIAKEGLIGLVVSRSPGAIAAFNSIDPLFGTNPIGFSFPTNEGTFVFDMATSAMTYYGLILASIKGEKIPENFAIDSEGEITIDPGKAMQGGILPFDRSYKGSSLAMMVELLSGPLISSSYCDFNTFKEEWGATFIAIDPEVLVDIVDFKDHSSKMINTIRSSRTKNGEKIRLPGDSSREKYREAKKLGVVDIEENILTKLGMI